MSQYTRFLDIHFTSEDKQYDFADDIDKQRDYKKEKNPAIYKVCYRFFTKNADGTLQPELQNDKPLPNEGFVEIAVKISNIKSDDSDVATQDFIKKCVTWVSSQKGNGKIRFNCHGDGAGNVKMINSSGVADSASGSQLAEWLIRNGLQLGPDRNGKSVKGLSTVNMCLCLAAADNNTPPTQTSVAPSSVIGQFVNKLRQSNPPANFTGLEVTGSYELVSCGSGQAKAKSQCAYDFERVEKNNKVVKLKLPKTWPYSQSTKTQGGWIQYPESSVIDFTVAGNAIAGCDITYNKNTYSIPEGWLVIVAERKIYPPLRVKVNKEFFGGGVIIPMDSAETLSHSKHKMRVLV